MRGENVSGHSDSVRAMAARLRAAEYATVLPKFFVPHN